MYDRINQKKKKKSENNFSLPVLPVLLQSTSYTDMVHAQFDVVDMMTAHQLNNR